MSEFGIWGATAPPAPQLQSLQGSQTAEVVVIGAGYTGLSTTLHLAERGVSAVLLDAQEPGWGASGRNTGWLEPNWWVKQPADIVKQYGAERAALLSRWVASGPQQLAEWEARYGLRTERQQLGLLLATDKPARAAALESEVRDWQALGVRNEYLDRSAIAARVPTDAYLGGMLLAAGATMNPLALARELARASMERGAQLYARSPVTAIARQGSHWQVTTPEGAVRAGRLVLATDAYTRDLWPELAASYSTWHMAVIGSEPYVGIGELLPANVAFADLGFGNIFTLRSASGGRLVSSTFAPLRRGLPPAAVARPFMRKFRKVFPAFAEPQWQFTHRGEIGLSIDMLPRLCAIGPDAWTAYGYSGTGMNFSLLLGRELAQLAVTGDEKSVQFPLTGFAPVKIRRALSLGLKYLHGPLARHVISRVA